MRKLNLIFLFVSVVWVANGQRIRFSNINLKEGLSQSTVNDIVQDKFGYLWIATQDGLNRFDGISMEIFNDDPSLPPDKRVTDGEILCLHAHINGNLYIGTNDGGLNIYNSLTASFNAYPADSNGSGPLSNRINDIIPLDENTLLISSDAGLDAFDLNKGTFRHLIDQKNFPDLELDFKAAFPFGTTIAIATYGDGLLYYDLNSGKIRQYYPRDTEGEILSNASQNVRTLLRDARNRMWIGFQGESLALFEEKTGQFRFFDGFPGRVSSILEDHDGKVWVGTEDGLARYNDETDEFEFFDHDDEDQFSIADNYVLSLTEDEAHTIWVGTNAGGVSGYHRTLGRFNHVSNEQYSDLSLKYSTKVFGFEEDRLGKVWIATLEGGLAVFDFKRGTSEFFLESENRIHNSLLCLEYTSDDKMWLGSYGGGINYMDLKTGEFSEPLDRSDGLPSGTILDMVSDVHGNIWVGTYKGLAYYDRLNDTIISYTISTPFKSVDGNEIYLPSGQINTLLLQRGGDLWIGTEGGVALYNMHHKTLRILDESHGLSSNSVYTIAADNNGLIWIGTKSGLNAYDRQADSIRVYTTRDGLRSNFIYGILIDGKNALWLSTNNGITKFAAEDSQQQIYVRHYNEIDGLQGNEFNQGAYYKSAKGRLFFGGVNGFNHFMPSDIVDNPHKPSVVLRSFKIRGKEYQLDTALLHKRNVELSYKDNFIAFEFAALDFVQPEKNMYMYKMQGLDPDWSEPTHRNYASYTDLTGGDYVFMVRAANNNGVWSDEIYELHIRIIPPFWQTRWFYALCVVAAILAVLLFIRLRMRKIRREKKILEEKVALRTSELAAKTDELAEKNRDITDSIQYAKKIQTAILPEHKYIEENLSENFVLYKPKDIVSGDFYWFGVKDNLRIYTAVDCTGHGVPGAFMSMIGSNLLNQIILEKGVTEAGTILKYLNAGVQNALKQGTDAQETNDGMDIALCTFDPEKLIVQYAGAFNPLYWIHNGELTKITANKYPIGGAHMELDREYITHKLNVSRGDMIYMFSDGYVDQFGGEKGKKFMGKRFQELLLTHHRKPLAEQKRILNEVLEEWRGNYEQVDDICVIGFRI